MSRNKIFILIVAAILIVQHYSSAQISDIPGGPVSSEVAFTESSLPIVVINTNGQTIKDEPKIIVNMGIIYNGPGVRNHLTDPSNEYNGKIAIEIRGSSSQTFPKKSYGFETRDNTGNIKLDVPLFGMSREHDWILSANYTDKSFCRNVLTYQLSREMGHYAAHTKYVDVVLNGTYMGIYVFMESIKRDSGRVDISKLHPTETTPPDITGGYIIKVDKTTGTGTGGWTSPYPPINHSNGQKINFQYDYPSGDSLVPIQEAYIQSYVDSFEDALSGSNFRDSINGYPRYIGNASWMDYFFCNELSKNVDGYRISSYLYKDKSKKLRAGPVWDYDIAWGNANYCAGNDTTGWAYLFSCTGDGYQVPFWWQKLLQDTNYTNEMKCRWTNFRQTVLSEQHIYSAIDSIATLLNESKTWNFAKWPILGTYVWPNPSPQPTTYAGEIQNLKNWVHRRLIWLDSNLPGRCLCSLTASVQNASCNSSCDGRAIALGTSSYKKYYLWSNGNSSDTIFDLCAGSYGLTLNDAIGCSKTITANITQPAALSLNTNTVNATCVGGGCNGSATVSASGGSSPYSYTWSTGQSSSSLTSLCIGSYSVTVSDIHGCTKSSSVSIQNPSAPAVSLAFVTGVSCYGGADGSAGVNVTGGSGPYTYNWSPAGGNSFTASGLMAGTYTVTVTNASGCSNPFVINIPQPSAPIFNSTIQNAVCHGSTGMASVSMTGGTAPYTYLWMPGGAITPVLNSAQPGNYTLTVTDSKGCTASTPITISQPAAFSFNSSTVSPTCYGGNNGSADVGASGGTGTLTYSWSPTGDTGPMASHLSADDYTVTVTDASGCTGTTTISIADPLAISLNTSSTLATCGVNNGTATVSATHGTQPYHYSWFPSSITTSTANNLNTGNHIITVTDANGCVAVDTVVVGSASGLSVSVGGQTEVSCAGRSDASVSLIVSNGASPYTYSWSPSGGTSSSASNLAAGTYSVSITETNGCNTNYQLTVTEPFPLTIQIDSASTICSGSSAGILSVEVAGGTGPYSYQWSPGGGSTQTVTNLSVGNYIALVTDSRGCSSSASASINKSPGILITINKTSATCSKANGMASAVVSGGLGAYNYLWSTGDTGLVAEDLFAGNYSITVTDSAGCSQTQNFSIGGTVNPVLSISNINSVTCNGGNNGSVTINASGGAGSYSYSWTPNVSSGAVATNLNSGIYNVLVTDAGGCRDSMVFILPQPAPLAALIFSENVKCFGAGDGLLYADAGGGTPPYSYSWTGGQFTDTAFNLSPGTYSLLITDSNNCSTTASGTISEPDSLHITFDVINATCSTCVNGSISAFVSGGVLPYSFDWAPGNQNVSSIKDLGAGVYTLCVTDGNGCRLCDSAKVDGGGIGVFEITRNSGIYVYPNPFNESTIFAFTLNSRQLVDIKIYSASGTLVSTVIHEELEAGEQLIRFNAADFSPGIYFYRFTNASRFQAGALVINR